jgi:DNA-binding NtrC family response regulator
MLSSSEHAPDASGHPAATARSVLLVDDEATLRSALRRYFERRGWCVVEAADGEQARALLLDGAIVGGGFTVVITDMRMPRLSGMSLHDLVSAIDPIVGSRFIFSSGDMSDDEAVAFIARTGCPVIEKPFALASLLDTVERIVASSAKRAAG